MASTINSLSTGSGGITSTGDASGVLALQTNSTTAITIDTSQNIGINTVTTTGGRLTVSQNNSTQPAIYLPVDESTIQGPAANTQIRMGGNLVLQSGNVTAINAKNASGYINFNTGATPTEAVRIDASGNLLLVAAGNLNLSNLNTYSSATSGYQKLPSGIIIQWSNGSTSSSAWTAFTFPIAFPTACFQVVASWRYGSYQSPIYGGVQNGSITRTGFNAAQNTGADNFGYIAIGY